MTPPELRMVVPNLAKFPRDLTERHMYSCPCTEDGFDPSYRHYEAKYLGNYINKGVQVVSVVTACVRISTKGNSGILWQFGEIDEAEAFEQAERRLALAAKEGIHHERPRLVFLQEQLSRTDFQWDASGGLQGSRVYFDLTELAPTDVKDLATKLRDVPWSALPKCRPE